MFLKLKCFRFPLEGKIPPVKPRLYMCRIFLQGLCRSPSHGSPSAWEAPVVPSLDQWGWWGLEKLVSMPKLHSWVLCRTMGNWEVLPWGEGWQGDFDSLLCLWKAASNKRTRLFLWTQRTETEPKVGFPGRHVNQKGLKSKTVPLDKSWSVAWWRRPGRRWTESGRPLGREIVGDLKGHLTPRFPSIHFPYPFSLLVRPSSP